MRGFYNYPTKPAFVIPCACGSREAYWHGPEDGARAYCCDPCWQAQLRREALAAYRRDEAHEEDRCACGARLPATVTPLSWQDNGFCGAACAAAAAGPFTIRGTVPALELARMPGPLGPGFETALTDEWRARLQQSPGLILWLWKLRSEDDSAARTGAVLFDRWSWRMHVTDPPGTFIECVAFRLTARLPACCGRTMVKEHGTINEARGAWTVNGELPRVSRPGTFYVCYTCGHTEEK